MLLHGDEIGRTQRGNNNAYCQDNEISWVDWRAQSVDKPLLEFAGRLVELRKKHPVFRRRRFFQGHDVRGARATDEIAWFRPDGRAMGGEDWTNGYALAVCVFLNGSNMAEVDYRGETVVDDSFLLLMNGHGEALDFSLPDRSFGKEWQVELDTSDDTVGTARAEPQLVRATEAHRVPAHGLVLLRRES